MNPTITYLPKESWPATTWDEVCEHILLPSLTFQFTKWNRKICVQAERTGERKWRCTFARWFRRLPHFTTAGNVSRLDLQALHYRYLYRTVFYDGGGHLTDNSFGDDVRILQFSFGPGPRAAYWLSLQPCDGTLLPPEPGAVSPFGGIVRLRPHQVPIELQQHAHKMRERYINDCTARNAGMVRSSGGNWVTQEQRAAELKFLKDKNRD